MTPEHFIATRQHAWGELRSLVAQSGARRRLRRLGGEKVRRMGDLYREVAADLGVARLRYPALEPQLSELVNEAHALLYAPEPVGVKRAMYFIPLGFPRLVRENGRFVAAGSLLLLGPMLFFFVFALVDPSGAVALLPPGFDELVRSGPTGGGITPGAGAISFGTLAFTEIFLTNMRVGFLVFAGGMIFGAGAAFVLIANGTFIGALLGLFVGYGHGIAALALVLPHGVLELACIVIAGAAGAKVGWSLIDPGPYKRSKSVALAASDAVKLIFGVTVFLFVAALIEGYVTPSSAIGEYAKIAIGLSVGLAFILYLMFAGRRRVTEPKVYLIEATGPPKGNVSGDFVQAERLPTVAS